MEPIANDPTTSGPDAPAYTSAAAGPVGTYALIVGVSDYPFLEKGTHAPPPEVGSFELGQLATSALTAYRFFEWIRDAYEFGAAPLAKCWLLLSPSAAELEVAPQLAGYTPATMENCVAAITAWYAALQSLDAASARDCRTVFFFSGHGIQREEGQQVLLPSDYLKGPVPNVNEALDTRNLRLGLGRLPRGEDLFFVDACRVNPPKMKDLELRPRQILPVPFTSPLNPDRVAPVLFAASSGAAAWQPSTPSDGISCYGQALIEGLTLPPEKNGPQCGHPNTHVRLVDLFRFMKPRIIDLLAKRGSVVKKPLDIDPFNDDVCITELLAPLADASGGPGTPGGSPEPPVPFESMPPPPPPPPPLGVGPPLFPGAADAAGAAADAPSPTAERTAPDLRAERREAIANLHASLGLGSVRDPGPTLDSSEVSGLEIQSQAPGTPLHEVFASETITEAWESVRSFRLDGAADSTAPFVLRRVKRAHLPGASSQQFFEVELDFADNGAHWIDLRIPDREKLPAFGLVLPANPGRLPPRFLVEMTRDDEREYAVEVSLAGSNPGPLGDAAGLWVRHRDLDRGELRSEIDHVIADSVLQGKVESPLGALVAAIVLVRAGRGTERADWLRNLAQWFPELPDAVVLSAEVTRQQWAAQDGEEPTPDWGRALVGIAGLPLPGTNYALQLATRQVREVLAYEGANPGWLAAASAAQLEAFQQRLQSALRLLHGRGLFAVFAGQEVSADVVLPRNAPPMAAATALAFA